jgi:hypothetical protein
VLLWRLDGRCASTCHLPVHILGLLGGVCALPKIMVAAVRAGGLLTRPTLYLVQAIGIVEDLAPIFIRDRQEAHHTKLESVQRCRSESCACGDDSEPESAPYMDCTGRAPRHRV